MSVGERIVELRKAQNISQAELASIMGVTRQAVSKWENDLSSPDTLNLIRLSDVLDCNIEYLATGRQSHSPSPATASENPAIKTVEVEKIIEIPRPVIIEKIVEVEKPVEVYIEKPVIRKSVRTKYVRNPIEFLLFGLICLVVGVLIGLIF